MSFLKKLKKAVTLKNALKVAAVIPSPIQGLAKVANTLTALIPVPKPAPIIAPAKPAPQPMVVPKPAPQVIPPRPAAPVPVPSAAKPPVLVSSDGPTGFTRVTSEGGSATFNSPTEVAYGAAGKFVFKTVTGPVKFDNATFGDPIVGIVKAGYSRPKPATVAPVTVNAPVLRPSAPQRPQTAVRRVSGLAILRRLQLAARRR